ncbi:MAG TPA: hypothetical protein VN541_09855, partial [Tepidisphaeraceae bacterium]|nr:hypothetical protein [Tepidisphaeraceae bacterium]
MPKYVSIGTSLGLISRFANKRRAAAGKRRAPAPAASVARAAMETLEDRLLMSRSWYVAPTGNNGSAGTLAAPFQTIQQAANVAGWGDTVYIEGGTYRETVKPVSGGVTFTNYNNQAVTVSGTDVISGFSNYSGSIYKAYMPEDLGAGNNE